MSPFLIIHRLMRDHWSSCVQSIVLTVAMLSQSSVVNAQTIPSIGSVKWYFEGIDEPLQRSANIITMDHAVTAGIVLLGTNTHTNGVPLDRKDVGELIALSASTGQLIRRDSVCPRYSTSSDFGTLRTSTINDSGTVVCYSCYADGVHLATWPDLVPIVDTMLRGAINGWISNTGRYMVLALPGPTSWGNTRHVIYDRLTGDTVAAPGAIGYEPGGAQFSADDRYLLMRWGGPQGSYPIIVGLPEMRVVRDDFPRSSDGTSTYYTLSRNGRRILARNDHAKVYDVESGESIWGIDGSIYPIETACVLSPDGTEVIARRSKDLLDSSSPSTATRRAFFRYSTTDWRPNAMIDLTDAMPSVGSGWGYPPGTITDGFFAWAGESAYAARVTYDPATGIGDEDGFTPILYPNPASSSVTMQLGACTDASSALTIHDQSGKVIRQNSVPCHEGTLTFDVSGMPAGAYVVSVATPGTAKALTAMLVIR